MFKTLILLLVTICCQTVSAEITTVSAFPNLTFVKPVDLQNAGDGQDFLYLAQQSGQIFIFDNSSTANTKTLFLDISDRIKVSGEQGLLGFVFHPKYSENGFFFVNYTRADDGATVIARFHASNNVADPASEIVFLKFSQPYSNHNGGSMAFTNNGLLLISSGDGGSGGDPENFAQNRRSLLGKIIRINVDQPSRRKKYSIPRRNPFFKNNHRFRKEIFAYGLRNPWRMSFDSVDKQIWIGDVGQSRIEEVNIIRNGGNYGWRLFEGNDKFNCEEPACSARRIVSPTYSYGHNVGTSITGGYVYRGTIFPELFGKYIFADFVSGKIFTLTKGSSSYTGEIFLETEHNISSFGVDEAKEIYFLDYGTGKVNKLVNLG